MRSGEQESIAEFVALTERELAADQERRRRVLDLLGERRTRTGSSRRARVALCGAPVPCEVPISDPPLATWTRLYCRDRWCPVCARRRFWSHYAAEHPTLPAEVAAPRKERAKTLREIGEILCDTEGRDGYDPTMTDMPPLPPPTPSIKLTLEGLATLLGLKVCSHGDLGFAFGSGPVLASHEAATVIREVVANLRTRAREEGEAAESLRAQLGETSNTLAEVSEILHRAWPEHMSGDPVQLARAAVEAITSAEAMRAETLAEGREQAGAARLEIAALRERLDTTNYHMQQHIAESNGIRKRLGELLDAPATEDYDQIAARICDLLEIRDRYTAVCRKVWEIVARDFPGDDPRALAIRETWSREAAYLTGLDRPDASPIPRWPPSAESGVE